MDIAPEVFDIAVLDPFQISSAFDRLRQADGIELKRDALPDQPFDIFLRVSVRMGQNDADVLPLTQGEQRIPQGGRPRVKRHFQQQLVRPLQTQAGKVVKPFHAVADQDLGPQQDARKLRPARQRRSAARSALQKGGGVLAVRVEVRRGADGPDP